MDEEQPDLFEELIQRQLERAEGPVDVPLPQLRPTRSDDWSWTLSFHPVPGNNYPVSCRIRRLLKAALRSFGLRCTRVWGPDEHPGRKAA